MNEDRIAGAVNQVAGRAENRLGGLTGNTDTQLSGAAREAKGAAQEAFGRAKDTADEAVQSTVESAKNFESWLRGTIEEKPYTTALVVVGLAWLMGRMHRPL